MCGIAGWLGTLLDSERYAARVIQALRHRGPDAEGICSWPEATLIHTRLSIIDLSPTGAQPMANEDGTIWTVFNGEIYNHRELRRQLEARGHAFKGRSDTEIIPHLYEEEGPGFVGKLRGMFALAVYDRRTRTLVLARDRFGIKPLFYAPEKDRLIFASENSALLELPGVDVRPDRQAIYDFAALFYIPAPETFYTGIRALMPGEILEARQDTHGVSWKTQSYHRWAITSDPTITLHQATDRAEALLTAAVRQQLESDVPLGALLSGGIDSSLVSAAAQEVMSGGLRTFNVRFADKEYDETWAAVAVAKHIDSHHETLDMNDFRGTWDYVTDLLCHTGQPFADTSLFAVNSVCRLMRRYVTVALSGDGGDEGFGGYNTYWQIARVAHWQRLPVAIRNAVCVTLAPLVRFEVVPDRILRQLRDLSDRDNASIVQYLFCWMGEQEHKSLCLDTDVLPVRRLFEPEWEHSLPPGASLLERLSAHTTEVNVRLILPNDFLFKVDIASMRESLEVRVPMLDEDLFAFGLSLPHHLKVDGRTCKRVLRALAGRKLPPAITNKPKWGFAIPLDTWVDEDFKGNLRNALLGHSSKLSEFFRPEAYRPMLEAFCDGQPCPGISQRELYQRAIMLLAVQLAMERDVG
jgi:asparagine synthase (glutamine-hydrolysing)